MYIRKMSWYSIYQGITIQLNPIILDSLHLIGFKIQESERNFFGFKGTTLVYALSVSRIIVFES
jgi:hypothetical protein